MIGNVPLVRRRVSITVLAGNCPLNLVQRGIQQLETAHGVDALVEIDIDFGAAARRGRPHQPDPDDAIRRLLQRARDRDQHLLAWQIARSAVMIARLN